MKHRIITSSNEDPKYLGFWSTVAASWKKYNCIPCLAFITNRESNDVLIDELKKYGEVYIFKPSDKNIPIGNQAKVARTFLASKFENDLCTLIDIDLYLLHWKWFHIKIDPDANHMKNDPLVCIGMNGYKYTVAEGKVPMSYITGKGKLFKSLANPNNLVFNEWVETFMGIDVYDHKEDISLPLYTFSDESLYRVLFEKWEEKDKILHIDREDCYINPIEFCAMRRIDRGRWAIDYNMLENNQYIDCAPLRSLQDNYEKIIPILKYLKVYDNDRDQKYFMFLNEYLK